MSKRTPVEALTHESCLYVLGEGGSNRMFAGFYSMKNEEASQEESLANVKTAAIAHTAANKLDELGIDSDKAIELLPKLFADLKASCGDPEVVLDYLSELAKPA